MRIINILGGPKDVDDNPVVAFLEVWRDHGSKVWVVQKMDGDFNQIGEVSHHFHKADARTEACDIGRFAGIPVYEYTAKGKLVRGWHMKNVADLEAHRAKALAQFGAPA